MTSQCEAWAASGRQDFRSAGREIGHDRIDRNAASRDQDAGLSGRAEVDIDATPDSNARVSASAVYLFLAQCAIGADGQHKAFARCVGVLSRSGCPAEDAARRSVAQA